MHKNNKIFATFVIVIMGFFVYTYFNNVHQRELYDNFLGHDGTVNVDTPYNVKYISESPAQLNTPEAPSVLNTGAQFYPNYYLPAQVIGCGGRRGACMGGSQIPIPNTLPPVDISAQNIAPVNIAVRGYDDGIQQVGVITKVFGHNNDIFPLFGRRLYRNDTKWEYFAKVGPYGVTIPVVPLRNYEELNTNDRVFLEGQKEEYRVTMYDSDVPQYLPYY